MLEDKVQIHEQSHLEHDKGDKEFLDSPLFDERIVELNHFLNRLLREHIILVSVG